MAANDNTTMMSARYRLKMFCVSCFICNVLVRLFFRVPSTSRFLLCLCNDVDEDREDRTTHDRYNSIFLSSAKLIIIIVNAKHWSQMLSKKHHLRRISAPTIPRIRMSAPDRPINVMRSWRIMAPNSIVMRLWR